MALNLWNLGTGKTTYSPLPTSWSAYVNLGFGDFVLTFRAKSPTSAILRVKQDTQNLYPFNQALTQDYQTYTIKFTNNLNQNLFFYDASAKGDIIIDSITLVQKPLNKLTINGVDGFLSGKWNLHPNAQVIDDSTLVLNANGSNQVSTLTLTVSVGSVVTLSHGGITGGGLVQILDNGAWKDELNSNKSSLTYTMTTTSLTIRISNAANLGTFTFSKPMLNLGSIPAPYSKKTGDRMVMPTPKKNLLPSDVSQWSNGGFQTTSWGSSFTTNTNTDRVRYNNPIKNVAGKTVTISTSNGFKIWAFESSSTDTSIQSNASAFNTSLTFTATQNTSYLKIMVQKSDGSNITVSDLTNAQLQVEIGTVATPYAPYNVQVNKKPQRTDANGAPTTIKRKTGLSFNGLTDYLQLPSMTMDAIEIECLIDSNQPGGVTVFFDARNGYTNAYVKTDGTQSGVFTTYFNGIQSNVFPNGVRTKLKIVSNTQFTDDVTLFASSIVQTYVKGKLYKVTCYLAGNIVAQYDFENPKNIVGNQVIPNAQNLIPSFEDARWSIHANAKVLGKDVLHLDATATFQGSYYEMDVLPNTTYLAYCNGIYAVVYNPSNSWNSAFLTYSSSSFRTFNTGSTTRIRFLVSNGSTPTGPFDFIKPQLYQISGKEGTIYGSPIQLNKSAKRQLYAKR